MSCYTDVWFEVRNQFPYEMFENPIDFLKNFTNPLKIPKNFVKY